MTPDLAASILQRVGETGQPPEIGIEHLNVGNETVLGVLTTEYLEPIARSGRESSFKVVQGYYGGGKTHFLNCVRQRAWGLHMCTSVVGLSIAECAFDDPRMIYAAVAREFAWAPIDPNIAPDRGIENALHTALDERRAELGEPALTAWIDGTIRRLPVDSPSYLPSQTAPPERSFILPSPTQPGTAPIRVAVDCAWILPSPPMACSCSPSGVPERGDRQDRVVALVTATRHYPGRGRPRNPPR